MEDEQLDYSDPVVIIMYADDATIARACGWNGSRVNVVDAHGGMYRDSTEDV